MEIAGSLGTAVHRELSLQKHLLPNHSKWMLVKAAGHWVLQELDTGVGGKPPVLEECPRIRKQTLSYSSVSPAPPTDIV